MPRIFTATDIQQLDKEVQKDYFDRHTPVIECPSEVNENDKLPVRIFLGSQYAHPDDGDHFIGKVQLWNRETLLAEATIFPGAMGNQPGHVEVVFTIIPKVSMNLTAMSYCTKHGLWQSLPKEVKVNHPDQQCSKS
jgi:superoxide reductase